MDFESLGFENVTLSQKIAQAIADQIAEGKIKPGERLLEHELTAAFGTSRAPIREALYILEKEGIVERIPRRGVFVKRYSSRELFDLYDVVYRLEEIALQKVIQHASDEQLDELEKLIDQMALMVTGRNVKKFYSILEELHVKFFDLSNNLVLKELYLKINNQLRPFRYISLSYPSSLEHSLAEYREILNGLRKKDGNHVKTFLLKKEKRALTILENYAKEHGMVDDAHVVRS